MAKNPNNCCASEEQKKDSENKGILGFVGIKLSLFNLSIIRDSIEHGYWGWAGTKGIGEKGSARKTTKQILFEKCHNEA